jgi:hypothetical protein
VSAALTRGQLARTPTPGAPITAPQVCSRREAGAASLLPVHVREWPPPGARASRLLGPQVYQPRSRMARRVARRPRQYGLTPLSRPAAQRGLGAALESARPQPSRIAWGHAARRMGEVGTMQWHHTSQFSGKISRRPGTASVTHNNNLRAAFPGWGRLGPPGGATRWGRWRLDSPRTGPYPVRPPCGRLRLPPPTPGRAPGGAERRAA